MPEFCRGLLARTLRGVLVNLLLHIAQRQLQVEPGQMLPAQAMRTIPGVVGRQCQAVGQQDAVGWLGQPAPQRNIGIEHLLLVQRVLIVARDVQRLDQLAAIGNQQAVALDHPVGQAPALGQSQAQGQQRHAEQVLLDSGGRLGVGQHALFPLLEQLGMGRQQRPDRREKQQAAPVDLLPEPRQAPTEQTAGLLGGMLANQLDLPQRQGDFLEGASGLALHQLQGALQSQSTERTFQAFGAGAETARLLIGLP